MSEQIVSLEMHQSIRVLPRETVDESGGISILEKESFYEIRSALPNVQADDLIVGVVDDVLTIGARMSVETQNTTGRFFSIDHRVTLVEQSFALPSDTDTRDMTTVFHDGVLSVTFARIPNGNVIPFFVR